MTQKPVELKIENPYFHEVVNGNKKCEIRNEDDRRYKVGQVLLLCQWNKRKKEYTGRYVVVKITHILRDLRFVKRGYAVLSFELLEVKNAFKQMK